MPTDGTLPLETVCWQCSKHAVWTVTGVKAGQPEVVVQFYCCAEHVPFSYEEQKAS
jgi:hypothetical protein